MKTEKQPPNDDVLWDVNDIATYLKRTPDNVRRKVITLAFFPEPIRIEGGHPRWYPSEVKHWAYTHR